MMEERQRILAELATLAGAEQILARRADEAMSRTMGLGLKVRGLITDDADREQISHSDEEYRNAIAEEQEINRLRAENYAQQEALRSQLARVTPPPPSASASTDERLKQLETQITALREEIRRLRESPRQ